MHIKIFIGLLLLVLNPICGYTQKVVFENNTSHTLKIALALYRFENILVSPLKDKIPSSSQVGKWVTKGWFSLEPGSKITLEDCIEKKEFYQGTWIGYNVQDNSLLNNVEFKGFDCDGYAIARSSSDFELVGSKTLGVSNLNNFEIEQADSRPNGLPFTIFKGNQNLKLEFN